MNAWNKRLRAASPTLTLTLALVVTMPACDDGDGKPTGDRRRCRLHHPRCRRLRRTRGRGTRADRTPEITLLEWVDGLVTNFTTPTADPDTVEDKNVRDTSDRAAFDELLQRAPAP